MQYIKLAFASLLATTSILFAAESKNQPTEYNYVEETSGKYTNVNWKIEKKGNDYLLTGVSKKDTTILTTDKDYLLKEYRLFTPDKETDYTIMRDGSKLHAKGKVKGKEMSADPEIGDLPWSQQLGFNLKEFALSNKQQYYFYSIDPKNFSANKLIAKKDRVGNLTLNKKTYMAQHMTITLPGFEGMFWSAEIWFDKNDGTFLLYKGNDGPNTPTTTIALESMK